MAQRQAPGSHAKGRDHRPHHISSIAHHFFDEEVGTGSGTRLQARELAICSAGNGPLGAWVCAGLAKALAGESAILGEASSLTWSATSFFPASELDPIKSDDHPLGRKDRDLRFWRVLATVEGADQLQKRGTALASASRVVLRNFGVLDNLQLGILEAAQMGSRQAGSMLPGGEVLVWCLTPAEAVSLGAAYSLGRTLSILKPEKLEVLVVDERWLDPNLAQNSVPEGKLRTRCNQLVAAVSRDCPADFNYVPAGPKPDPMIQTAVFQTVGQRALDHDYSD